jgi:pantoate kinase
MLRHELPIGQGFGLSAAGALATALATGRALDLPRARAIETAHLADLFGRGGLGGVSAILGGGLEIRRRAGIPPWGRVAHLPATGSLFLALVGRPIRTRQLLVAPEFLERVARVGSPLLARLARSPRLADFFAAAEEFTDAVGLASPVERRLIPTLRRTGAWVAQAMFGHSLFLRPRNPRSRVRLVEELARRRLPAVEVPIARSGAVSGAGPPPGRKSL